MVETVLNGAFRVRPGTKRTGMFFYSSFSGEEVSHGIPCAKDVRGNGPRKVCFGEILETPHKGE